MTVVFSTHVQRKEQSSQTPAQPEDSGVQWVPAEPQRTEGSRIRKLLLAARHAFDKSRGTNCVLPLVGFGPAPKASLCHAGWRKPTTRRNKGLGDSPGFGLLPLALAADSSLKIPPGAFPLRLCPKSTTVWGLHTVQWSWSQTLPLHYPTDHSSRDQLYSSSWETKRKSNRQSGTHHLLNTVFWYSPASAARCRSWTLIEEDYFII